MILGNLQKGQQNLTKRIKTTIHKQTNSNKTGIQTQIGPSSSRTPNIQQHVSDTSEKKSDPHNLSNRWQN